MRTDVSDPGPQQVPPSPERAAAPPAAAQPPAWFRRKREQADTSAQPPRGAKPVIVAAPAEAADVPLGERIVRWFVSHDAIGVAASLLLHAMLMVALSLVLYTEVGQQAFSTIVSEAQGIETELDEIDTQIDLEGGNGEDVMLPQLQAMEFAAASTQSDEPELPAHLLMGSDAAEDDGLGDGEGSGAGRGMGLPFRMPEGGKAVSKGSFTAWTVPEDPDPGQNYIIVIQIQLPDDVRRFPKRDLLGSLVVGTDGYRQSIPDAPRGFLPMKDRLAQMVILVPGASKLVKDTIQLQSRILKEKQTLQIVF